MNFYQYGLYSQDRRDLMSEYDLTPEGFGPVTHLSDPTDHTYPIWDGGIGIRPEHVRLKDSGDRRQFGTGAVRDRGAEKGRFDLLPPHGLAAVALHMERGAAKYSDRNWEQGIPLSVFYDSAMRHMVKAIAGYSEEPHLEAAAWNLLCLLETRERIKRRLLPVELDDLPDTYVGQEPGF